MAAGNSRWDLIDLVRMTYALRPEGIEWPRHNDGRPSFRLEYLAAANGIGHESAHDALSDVRATIGLVRLIRDRQPCLYDWLFQLRNKRKALNSWTWLGTSPFCILRACIRRRRGCTTLVMPMIGEPGNNNSVLVYDLRQDPSPFMDLDVEGLRDLLCRKPSSQVSLNTWYIPRGLDTHSFIAKARRLLVFPCR